MKLSIHDLDVRTSVLKLAGKKSIRVTKAMDKVLNRGKRLSKKTVSLLKWSEVEKDVISQSHDKNLPTDALIGLQKYLDDIILQRRFKKLKGVFSYEGGKTEGMKDILLLCKALIRAAELGNDFEFREPFIGGGSVTINVLANNIAPRARISDLNLPLTVFISTIIQDPNPIIGLIQKHKITKESADELIDFLYSMEDQNYHWGNQMADVATKVELDLTKYDKNISAMEIPKLKKYFLKMAFAKYVAQKTGVRSFGEIRGTSAIESIRTRWNPERRIADLTKLHDLLNGRIVGDCCHHERYSDAIDRPEPCFIFADPPYEEDKPKNIYAHSFTEEDHRELQEILESTRHPYLLTYGDHPLIRELYGSRNYHHCASSAETGHLRVV